MLFAYPLEAPKRMPVRGQGVRRGFVDGNTCVPRGNHLHVAVDLNILEACRRELPHEVQIENTGIHSEESRTDLAVVDARQLEIELVDTLVVRKRVPSVVAKRARDVAEAGDRGDRASGAAHPDLFAQTPRGIAQDSQERLAGDEIKRVVREGLVVGVALRQLDPIVQLFALQDLTTQI